MRYLIQLMAMFCDLLIIAAVAGGLFFCYNIFPINVILAYLIVKCFFVWQKQGGFIAWKPKMIKSFLQNAKDAGL